MWHEYREADARKLTEAQVAWRKRKYIEQLPDDELMEWTVGRDMVLLHASECPPMDEYHEFIWMPRPKEWE
jgi:hypothetical protein